MTEKPNIDVLILVALKDELDSLLKVDSHAVSDCEWTKVIYKKISYWRRDFLHEGNSRFTVACARAAEMGTPAISALGAVLIDQLNPRYLAMCGICAGREDKTNMGDIIVGSSVFNYEKGKVLRRFDGDKNMVLRKIV